MNSSPSGFSVHGDSLGKNAGVSCHALLQGIEELYKKGLKDPDNHNGVVTHLQPDVLECEVKWALGSITTNKANGGDGIPVELFQILKDDAVKVLHSVCQKFGKLSSGHGTGKSQFLFHPQGKAMPKNAQTTT